MSRPSSDALHHFIYWRWSPPYAETVRGQQVPVFRVKAKTGIAAGRQTMLAHVVREAAGVLIDGKVTYGARWICGPDGSLDAVFLSEDQALATGNLCRFCFPRIPAAGNCTYHIYDSDAHLIYIGSTDDVAIRIAGHRKTAAWRARIADVRTTTYPSLPAARAAEVAAIRAESPECNTLHRAGAVA
jgi:hypothetical protein